MRSAIVAALLAAIPTLGPSGRALAQSPGPPDTPAARELSLEAAVAEALAGNRDLAIAEARREIARKHSAAAAAPLWPRVDLGAGYTRSTDPVFAFGTKLRQGVFGAADLDITALNSPEAIDDWSTRIGVRWSLLDPAAWAGRSSARKGAEAAELSALRAREATILMTRVLYYRALMAAAQEASAEAAETAAQATYETFRQRRDRGLLTDADLLQAEAELAAARAALTQATKRRTDAQQELGRHLGWSPDTLPQPTDTLTAPGAIEGREFDPRERADVRARRAAAAAAARARTRAAFGWIPALDAFAEYATHGADPLAFDGDDWTVGLALRWTVFSGFARTADIQRASLERRVAELEYEQAVRDAQAEVQRAERAVQAAREGVEATRAAAQAAATGRDLMRRRFDEGLATAADRLQAEARATRMREQAINALAAYHVAVANLEFVRSQVNQES